jgi:hypothetical protein
MNANVSSWCNMRRGTLGFGEEALQSLPGKVGSQVRAPIIFLVFIPYEQNLVSETCGTGCPRLSYGTRLRNQGRTDRCV